MLESKGIRLEHITKIYQDPKTGKDFKAVDDADLNRAALSRCSAPQAAERRPRFE